MRGGRPAGMSSDSDSDGGLTMGSAPAPRSRPDRRQPMTNGAPAKVGGWWWKLWLFVCQTTQVRSILDFLLTSNRGKVNVRLPSQSQHLGVLSIVLRLATVS